MEKQLFCLDCDGSITFIEDEILEDSDQYNIERCPYCGSDDIEIDIKEI